MKLLTIDIENFRLHADTHITFPDGVVGIVGSNEAGKSTVLEAATWALYGGDTTRGTMGGIRWHGAPARHTAAVTLRFEVAGHSYRVERRESGAKLFDGETCIADGTAPVNEQVPKLLGLSYEEFKSSFLVQQKDVAAIASMKPTERVAFVRRVMGMGKIDAALKACRARKSDLAKERDGLIAGLGEREPLQERQDAAVAAHEAAQTAWSQAFDAVEPAEQAHDEARIAFEGSAEREKARDKVAMALENALSEGPKLVSRIEALERKEQAQEEARKRIAAADLSRLPALRGERDRLLAARAAQSEKESATQAIVEFDAEARTVAKKIVDCERRVGAYDPEEHARARAYAEKARKRFEDLRDSRTAQRRQLLSDEARLTHEAEVQGDRIDAISAEGEGGCCPTCARRLGDAYAGVIETLSKAMEDARAAALRAGARAEWLTDPGDDEIVAAADVEVAETDLFARDALEKDAGIAAATLETLRVSLSNAHRQLDAARERLASLPEAEFHPEQLRDVEAGISEMEALDLSLRADRALAAQEDETVQALADTRKALDDAAARVEQLRDELAEIDFSPERHAELQRAAIEAAKTVEGARIARARAEAALDGATKAMLDATHVLEDYDTRAVRLKEVSDEHLTHEHTAARLAEFRTAIASTIRPEMEELMSGFVHILTDGRHEAVELTEEFVPTLYENGVPVEVVSGGTEDIAALAMRLALSQMIAERAGHPLSLLILDEPFGSLDETRRGNVLSLIRQLHGVFTQVLVISHVAETREAVDHVVELEYDEGAGRAVVVSAPVEERSHAA